MLPLGSEFLFIQRECEKSNWMTKWRRVYDSLSADLYLEYNVTGMDAYYEYGIPSWYVNTSYNTTAFPNGTVYFNGHYYNVSGIPSASGHYHLGLLPETYNYLYYFDEVPAVLVTDSTTNYSYDTVYVDLDLDYDFTDEKPTNQSSPVSYRDDYDASTGNYTDAWNGGDGYPDWSGGMIYFIADGQNYIPGTDIMSWWYSLPNSIPGKGDIVAFVGDFDDYPHGTACAANAASRGKTIGGLGVGMAPQAKIMAEPHFWWDPFTEWLFAEIGYNFQFNDALDDAQIASNSWGNSYVHWDGWDPDEDRYLDAVVWAYPYFLGGVMPTTSFLVALGNGGPGYGTATSPAVQSAINVGAGSEWGYRQILFGDSNLYDSYYGDVVDFSARGPFANGKMTPDILTTGEFGITPMALNYPDIFGYVGDGSMHFDLFSGTSMATPVAAGGLALIYDAYYKTYGQYPDIWTAKDILQSSADDHNYDPLSQGPGWMNVSRAIDMITGKGGILIEPPTWNAGTYEGNEYSMFAGIVHPGDTISKDFELTNLDWNTSHSAHVELTPVTYIRKYEYNLTAEFPEGGSSSYWVNLSNLSTPIPSNIDLLQIIAYTDYTTLDDPNDTTHAHPNIYYNIAYLWDYINYTSPSNYTDRMRMQVSAAQGNTIDVMLHDPMRRLHGDMWYQLRVIKNVDMNMTFHIKIVGYVATPIPDITLSQSSVDITGGNGSATITATINVANDMPFGIYEAKILVDDGVHLSSIPIVMYVAPEITSLSDTVVFGGDDLSDYNTYLYDNSHIRGLYDWMWRAEAGDWRFFFLNITDDVDITNAYITVDISWENNLTDIDGFILGNQTDDWSGWDGYGPYTLAVKAQSKNMYISRGKYAWQTSSGGAREVISAPLQNGLMEIMLHNVLYAGMNASEKFTVRVYFTSYSPSSATRYVGDAVGLSGKIPVTFTLGSDTPSLDTRVNPLVYVDEKDNIPISTGQWNYYFLYTVGWTYLAVQTYCSDDIDLYMFYSDDGAHFYYSGIHSATSSGDEYVEISNPSVHPYWLAAVYGYDVSPGNTYDIVFYEGLPGLPEVQFADLPTNIVAGTSYQFNLTYDFTGYDIPAGTYITTAFFGPQGSGGTYSIHLTFNALDQRAPSVIPEVTGVVGSAQPTLKVTWNDTGIYTPPQNATWWIDGVKIPEFRTGIVGDTLYATPQFLLAEGPHEVKIYYEDEAGNGNTTTWYFTVDTTPPSLTITSPENGVVPLTYDSTLWINGTTDPGASVTINGISVPVDANGTFSYKATLVEGQNIFTVEAKDEVGNTATATVTALYLPQLPELWQAINNLNAQVSDLQSQINDMKDDISDLQGDVSSLQENLSALEEKVNALEDKVNSLEAALQENISALNKAIEDMNTSLIDKINDNIANLHSQINDLKSQADDLQSQINDIKAENDNQESGISNAVNLGYAGIILAIIALIIALIAVARKPKPPAPTAEAQESEESEE